MNTIHFVLQGKGGVGKSLISSIIAQYFQEVDDNTECIDTDPVNATLHGFKALNVVRLDIINEAKVNERNFDDMMELLVTKDKNFIIDNGASSFVPLSSYLVENKAVETLLSIGKKIVVHVVITGGQAMIDTLNGFNRLATQFPPEVEIVIWRNEFFGPVRLEGKDLEETEAYIRNRESVRDIVTLYRKSVDTFGKDVENMLKRRLTFSEAIASEEFSIMSKQRLKMMQRSIFDQLDRVFNEQG